MTYIDKLTAKTITLYLITFIGIPLWFSYGGTLLQSFFWFILAALISRLANCGYHRWLAHNMFEPNWISKKMLLYFMVLTAEAPPGHYIVTHLTHHKHSDKDGDPHGPKQIGFWRMLFGRWEESKPTTAILRTYAKNKDAKWVTTYYWHIYALTVLAFAIINPWLLVWLSFIFTYGWMLCINLNYRAHSGKDGAPKNLGIISNIFMGGEDLHKNHHDNPGSVIYGSRDTTGRYIVPLLQ
jgi:stearoyl-CoA desaturase (delta-9 desaturase)